MAILVTGGAGYIGSHTIAELQRQGYDALALDNLENGHRQALQAIGAELVVGDLRDLGFVRQVLKSRPIEAVIHFAAYIEAGESVIDPLKHYNNNVIASLNLLTAMREAGINKIVFSSTAATYGDPENIPIRESDRTLPINPYGETKLAVEKAMRWADRAYGLKSVALRYFNAAGAHPDGMIGEDHHPETHLLPIILQVALGKRERISVFGTDYNTPDGTCVRDYIHVSDLAAAHVKALEYLLKGGDSDQFNLGNGKGFSVMEVIEKARQITGKEIPVVLAPKRPGDPEILVADSQKAKSILGWVPRFDDLDTIIRSAWQWHSSHPDGYEA